MAGNAQSSSFEEGFSNSFEKFKDLAGSIHSNDKRHQVLFLELSR